MDEIVHKISAWDGFSLVVREWRDGNARTPLLCLPGIVRTSGDFETFAHALGAGRRVVSPDYAGRGQSGRSRDITRYAPEACLRDVLDICAALHLHQAIAIGTSFGGLLSMGLAAARPSLFRAVVLNDIGPERAPLRRPRCRIPRHRRGGCTSARGAAAAIAGRR
jgi:pimeloyl-ACP methyl ester carboxylesterase